ncbi:hypothetical protein KCP91_12020 [Microvirga sp. SRT01]|uniref:Uncharacterized protein n=1 Tax=Sphingomonas longa TaxID=2778730 RepID=A0ABS2D831_9SPHN|nr:MULTISPECIES: hypothetical protein [Alphaproteobacteria]MBM6577099.1 hypothetical protein [Sphingomonas sp. BT552]MBR7710143.1 hypothetical protein [Microvirga sp. SRT01]
MNDNIYIFLASETMNNEDMIALAVSVGRDLERIFPGRPEVASAAYTYGAERSGGRRGRRLFHLEFADRRDAVLFKLSYEGGAA